jgi:hypothetical protein
MKISFRAIAGIILIIGLLAHLIYFSIFTEIKDRTAFNFYTLIGGYISAAGILFTLFQLKSVREEAEAIKKSVLKYNNILTLVEVSNLASQLSEARNRIIARDFNAARHQLSALKPSVNTLINRISKQDIKFENDANAPPLKDLIFDFKSDVNNIELSVYNEDNFVSIDFALVLNHTDDLFNYFSNLAEHLKSLGHES